jgi:CD109 antigen
VTPKKVGYLPIKITARCNTAGDAIEQLLLVEPEGTPIYVNKAVLLDLRTDNTKSVNFAIEIPDVAVPGSSSATVSVFSDFLGNTIQNLDNLIQIPSGCGEQNMIAFVPNLLVAEYLLAVKQLTYGLRARIVSNLEIGYQRELNYQRTDGSFSCFGNSDKQGSIWLTAFVVRYFAEASAYIQVDDRVMSRALNWLVRQQSRDGGFVETGRVLIQGSDSDQGVGLTNHVLLALSAQPGNRYSAAIKKATDFIVQRLEKVNTLPALSIAAYALHKIKHASASAILTRLNQRATEKDGLKWWENSSGNNFNNLNVQITATALSAHAEAGLDLEAIPILQWLVKQRNSLGGFSSTQDTILSIQALAKFASRLYVKKTDIDVAISYDLDGLYNVKVNRESDLQNYELPRNTKSIKFDCKGTGFAVAQVSYKYYVLIPEPAPSFNLDIKLPESLTKNLNLTICTSFVANASIKKSNMAIVEVAFPSGYTFDRDTLEKLRKTSDVSVSCD